MRYTLIALMLMGGMAMAQDAPRKYSLNEIDEMRSYIETLHMVCRPANYSVFYGQENQSAKVENELRTYLMAGVGPSDIKEKAEKYKSDCAQNPRSFLSPN